MATDIKTLTDKIIRAGFPRRGAGGMAAAILEAAPQGGGGAGVPVRRSVFVGTMVRNATTGQVASVSWDAGTHFDQTNTVDAAPSWPVPYSSSDLILTPADGGGAFYEVAVDFSFGLPVADVFNGASVRLGRDVFDPVHRLFATVKGASGNGGVSGGFVRPSVWIDADDGFRLQWNVIGDPLTSALTAFTSSGPTGNLLRVALRRLS